MSGGQRAYEAKRAAKAGMSLEKWLAAKERDRAETEREQEREREKAKASAAPKKPGLVARLIERASRPL
jgi:hypothetical protein